MFVPIYPVTRDGNGVKATYYNSTIVYPHFATDPSRSLIGGASSNSWMSSSTSDMKFNVDLGRSEVCTRIRLDNYHDSGSLPNRGVRNFTIYGSNESIAFNNTTYSNLDNLTLIQSFEAREHHDFDLPDPEYFTFANETAYRYYILRISDNWGGNQIAIRRIEFQKNVTPGHSPIYLPINDATHVNTTTNSSSHEGSRATNRGNLVVGTANLNSYRSDGGSGTNEKFNVDLGSAKVIKRLYLENYHDGGLSTNTGIKDFTVYGSNTESDFLNDTYADVLPGMTALHTGNLTAAQHIAADNSDPQIFELTNTVAYRYYILRIADNHGDGSYLGFRRIHLLDEHTPHYPPIVDATTTFATLNNTSAFKIFRRFTALLSNGLYGVAGVAGGLKFIVDYGDGNAFAATRVMLENSHLGSFNRGINDFSVYGSNSLPSVTYADDTGLTEVATGFSADQSTTTNEHETQYFDFENTDEFRYYVIKVSSNHGGPSWNVGLIEIHGAGGAGPTPGADSDAIFFGCNF